MEPLKEKIQLKGKEEPKPSPESLPAEVNLLLLPFFAVSREDAYRRDGLKYEREVQREDGKEKVSWKVIPSSDYGYPTPFDKRVYKGIEELVNRKGLPAENPLRFSVYRLCELIGRNDPGGKDYREVKKSLEKLVATTVKTKGAYYLKGEKRYIDDVFHLFSRVVFAGEQKADGGVAETNQLYLNSWLLDNLNEHYVRPLDYSYYKNLNTEIAKRLYELLGVKFFGCLNQGHPFIRYKYSTLCKLIPLHKQKFKSKAKQIMRPAHRELVETNYLEGIEWKETKDSLQVYYHPGSKPVQEIKDKADN